MAFTGVYGLEFGSYALGFRGLGSSVLRGLALAITVCDSGFRVKGLALRV